MTDPKETLVAALGATDPKAPLCPECNGYGSSLHQEEERCTVCGGTGLVEPTQN